MIPVGKIGDILYFPNFCEVCRKHFLIREELEDHKYTHEKLKDFDLQ